jgi:hypothetical protein
MLALNRDQQWSTPAQVNATQRQLSNPLASSGKYRVAYRWCQRGQGGFTQTSDRLVCLEEVNIYTPRRIGKP